MKRGFICQFNRKIILLVHYFVHSYQINRNKNIIAEDLVGLLVTEALKVQFLQLFISV